jgi:hypothetical protein
MKVEDGCLNFRASEARQGEIKLIWGLKEVLEGIIRCWVGTRGKRLKDRGKVDSESKGFLGIAAGPRALRCPERVIGCSDPF